MLTEIGYLGMRVREFDACRGVYGPAMGLKEIGYGVGEDGHRLSLLATGPSVLELREDPNAFTVFLPSGERKESKDIPAGIMHYAFYVHSSEEAYSVAKEANLELSTVDGPALQPIDHTYM